MTGSLSRGLSAVALALVLASCTETVDCDVLHLSRLSPPAGERITVVAEDGQARSLEFAGYRALVENE